jgi:ppGpp synthetase/RelA/SpoT-type nucleotidyltranferase
MVSPESANFGLFPRGDDMPIWTEPRFNRGRVDAAGAALLLWFNNPKDFFFGEEVYEASLAVDNWRLSHQFPLQVLKMNLLKRSKKFDSGALVYQRIKRYRSIVNKLTRNSNMKLSQMQDIGGCRSVLRSVKQINDLVKVYEQKPTQSEFVKKYDYIAVPKPDGYRSIHLVYKYRSVYANRASFDGLRIEIQIRSRLQHAWASAVETVSNFTGQALKSNIGQESWKRFFVLMSNYIATQENCPLIPNSASSATAQKEELCELAHLLRVEDALEGWRTAVRTLPAHLPSAKIFVIALDLPGNIESSSKSSGALNIAGFSNAQQAFKTLATMERERAKLSEAEQPVMVSVNSLAALRTAFPSYHLDAQAFIETVKKAIA